MSEYLFVYGTLLPDSAPAEVADIISKLRPVGPAYIYGRLYDLGNYPGAILDALPNEKVFGKVFELPEDEALLSSLDAYEDYDSRDPEGSLFVRTKTKARLSDEREIDCWVYVYNHDPQSASLIVSGKWTAPELSTHVEKSA